MIKVPTLATFLILCLWPPAVTSALQCENLQPKADPYAIVESTIRSKNRNVSAEPSILFEYDESVPEGIRDAFDKARLLWESKLNLKRSFILYVMMTEFNGSHPLEVETSTVIEGSYKGCPYSLARQLMSGLGEDEIDAGIFLNNSIDWNTNVNDVNFTGYDAFTIGLRAIAISMGFGTSIMQLDKDYPSLLDYKDGYPNYFDQNICGLYWLIDLEPRTKEFYKFTTSMNVGVLGYNDLYELYTTRRFIPWQTFIYLNLDNTLMCSSFEEGQYFRKIDPYTIDILNYIGWDFDKSNPEIKLSEKGSYDNLSAYLTYHYTLEGTEYQDCKWRLLLKDKDGNYKTLKESTGNVFQTDALEGIEDYSINKQGYLEGIIECTYIRNGKSKIAPLQTVLIDVKPIISSIENLTIIEDSPYSFHAELDIRSIGSTELFIDIEEEYGGLRISKSYPYHPVVHGVTAEASSLYYSWIYITASNKYGVTEQVIEIPPKEYK